MSFQVQTIDFFNPIRWDQGSHKEEHFHWIGRLVEWYFDIGQKGCLVRNDFSPNGIPVLEDKRRTSFLGAMMKVVILAIKLLSYLTLVTPFTMLLGKLLYRSENNFIVMKPHNPDEIKKEIDLLNQLLPSDTAFVQQINTFDINKPSSPMQLMEMHRNLQTTDDSITSLLNNNSSALKPELSTRLKQSKSILENLTKTIKDKITLYGETSINNISHHPEQVQDKLDEWIKEIATWKDNFTTHSPQPKTPVDYENSYKRLNGYYATIEPFQKIVGACPIPNNIINEKDFGLFAELLEKARYMKQFFPSSKTSDELLKNLEGIFINPRGFPNLGNSCYMNAALQAVFANTELTKLIYNDLGQLNKDNVHAYELQSRLKWLHTAVISGNESAIQIGLYAVRSQLHVMKIIDSLTTEQDSGEVLSAIIEALGHKKNICQKTISYNVVTTDNITIPTTKTLPDDHSIMLCIPLSNGSNIVSPKIQKLVDDYFSEKTQKEKLRISPDDVEPPVYTEEFREKIILKNAPDTLIVNLNRYNNRGLKIENSVFFPLNEEIDFSKAFENGTAPDGKPTRYKVTAVLQHIVRPLHYTANILSGNEWIHCNDNVISNIGLRANLAENGYVFVLQRAKE